MGKQTNKNHIIYEVCAYIILLGTAYDIFWCILTTETLSRDELNPIAKWIVDAGNKHRNNMGVAILCLLKVLMTWKVIWICKYLIWKKPRIGITCIIGLAVFQIWLMFFLTFHK
tara:strand:+ start:3296 stop:3637 length:342 start_codon:yes stop_codon:yes gene_type:complete